MRYNLSDIERTLLSAYMDGELSTVEAGKAESLLASSEEARSYLRELRTVESISGRAFAVPAAGITAVAGMGAAEGMLGTKLTGSAIEAAAEKAVMAKAVALGSWGLAGVVGTAAAVAVGVALSLQMPKQITSNPRPVERPHAVSQDRSTVAEQVSSLDTSSLIVPPMTRSDLFAFAMHGTLPVNANRSCFITLAAKGGDSLTVRVHNTAPRDDERVAALAAINADQAGMLDSLQRVVRTSLIHSKRGIALRADIPALRLDVIRTFEQAAPRMPVYVREQLDRTRVELNEVARVFSTTQGRGGAVVIDGGAPIVYRMIPAEGLFNIQEQEFYEEPAEIVLDFDNEPLFAVDQHALRALESRVSIPMPPPPPPLTVAVAEEPHVNVGAGNTVVGAGSAPKRKPARALPCMPVPAYNGLPSQSVYDPAQFPAIDPGQFVVRYRRNDTLIIQADQAVREAEEQLERVDSMMQRLREKVDRKLESYRKKLDARDREKEDEKRKEDGEKDSEDGGAGSAGGGMD